MAANNAPVGGHEKIETSNFLMIVLILLAVAVGGLVEIVPLFFQRSTTQPVEGLKPYTALQLAGRDVYLREGCYNCHSQMVRPFRAEALRYGQLSLAGEFVYDHPFQWGSKRTGPDLHRVGGKYSDEWQRLHLIDPLAGARVEHAGLPVARGRASGRRRHGPAHDRDAPLGRALQRCRDRQGGRRRAGPQRARRAGGLPAGARHRAQVIAADRGGPKWTGTISTRCASW
jgi:hypothetical protein